MTKRERLFQELGGIQDAYKVDVKQFLEFMTEKRLDLVEGLQEYAKWLDTERDGKVYSPSTINRKIAAAKRRVRYAFKRSSSADSLRRKYQLDEVLREIRPKPMESLAIREEKVLSIEEVKQLIKETKDSTIRLMVRFLVGTGVRVSEMLAIKLSDLRPPKRNFVAVRVVGKVGKDRIVHVKTKLMDRIRKYFHGTTYLFEHHGRPYNRVSVTNRIKHESLRTIGREVTAQQLRHTWAVIQIQRGKAVSAVATALGHTDPRSTARRYSEPALPPHEAFLDIQDMERSGRSPDERKKKK